MHSKLYRTTGYEHKAEEVITGDNANFSNKGNKGLGCVVVRRVTNYGPGVVAFSDDGRHIQTRVRHCFKLSSMSSCCPQSRARLTRILISHPLSVLVEKLQVPRRKIP